METNEELINAACRHKEERGSANVNNGRGFCGNCSQSWPCITRRLADALEAAITEPGWEYGTAHREDPQVGAVEWSRARAEERVREWNETTQSVTGFVVRRRAAGPWLPVEGENNAEH